MLGIAFGLQVWDPLVIVLVPIVAFIAVGGLDRDAFIARAAIYQFGALQSARLTANFPTDPESAAAWLADPSHGDEVDRAYVLLNAGRPVEAIAALDRAAGLTPSNAAAAERLRLAIERQAGEADIDRTRFEALVADLPADERRWQRLSLAVMLLNADVGDGLPWRDRFVAAVRDLGPWRLARGAWFVVITQQFTMAITFAVLWVALLWLVRR